MPRYFFHVHNDEFVPDEEGQLFPDDSAARECALEGARDLVCMSVKNGHLNLDHYVAVADEGGQVLFHVTFREAFTLQGE